MKTLVLSSLLAFSLAPALLAADEKFEGQAVCAKCELHTADKCQAALQVTSADGKKETLLTESTPEAKDLHSEICKGGKPATVEGTVTEKDGKKMIKVTKYEIR